MSANEFRAWHWWSAGTDFSATPRSRGGGTFPGDHILLPRCITSSAPVSATGVGGAQAPGCDSRRGIHARHFLPDVSLDELPGVIEPMLKDRFMPVRRDALWYAATKRPDIAKQPLRVALLDNHVSMRETACQFLAVTDAKDAAGFYADALKNGSDKQRFAAICGLGETGKAADVPLESKSDTKRTLKVGDPDETPVNIGAGEGNRNRSEPPASFVKNWRKYTYFNT